ncbi:LysR family transcriptional regulator [Actinoallomurus iriomotensis]|uniref:LysR family transcriptional regulator n=2 Tax=Actinoallomurus iriomotensis TaxID=478107 RepID=A0A9W6S6E6_9ACTN|nr:LysR family transcriptional regulator [Actinoallomurus iriomotensis]
MLTRHHWGDPMELRHLRYFVVVAEEGSVNRAAQRLLVSQPSLSRQIIDLERQLGQQLLQRTSRGVKLTPAGQALLPHAHQLLAMADATRETVAGATVVRQAVTIGIPPGTEGSWLIDIVDAIRARVPRAAPDYVEANSSEQLRLLRQGRLDICIVHQAPPDGHAVRELRRDSLGIAVRPEHPLAARDSYRLSDLEGLRTLLHSQDQVPTQQHGLIAAAQAAGVRPHWHFSRFTEHALAHAYATESDAVLVGAHTAASQLPAWHWGPLTDLPLMMTTWLATERNTRAVVQEVAETITNLCSADAPT